MAFTPERKKKRDIELENTASLSRQTMNDNKNIFYRMNIFLKSKNCFYGILKKIKPHPYRILTLSYPVSVCS